MRQWTDVALPLVSRKHRRRRALRRLIAEYEAEHGAFTEEELEARERRSQEAADEIRTAAQQRVATHESRA